MPAPELQHFYISEEQSIYLLKADDARKHRDWIALCQQQLLKLGYQAPHLIGKGAYGFVFAGHNSDHVEHVFKFSRVTLPQNIQDRLEEEAFILGQLNHPNVPALVKFDRVGNQGILVMERARGEDLDVRCRRLGALPVHEIMSIARQLADLLIYLRVGRPLVHGDIKPSNLIYDQDSDKLSLIDWGSAVFAQRDADGQPANDNVLDTLSTDQQHTNARMGDVYFIGEEQLSGELSSPRFDEQGVAATLYALASGQISRFGSQVIPATSLGLPQELARTLDAMLSSNPTLRMQGSDYFLSSMKYSQHLLLPNITAPLANADIPVWIQPEPRDVETVSYSSRKSFLKSHQGSEQYAAINQHDIQLEKYYRNFLVGMGDTEKGFIASVSRLGQYPIVGGLAIHWREDGVYIDSNLALYDEALKPALLQAVNNMVALARGIGKIGVFKACFFNAKDTQHFERDSENSTFVSQPEQRLPFEIGDVPNSESQSRWHSYFEDGKDPDENLELPVEIMNELSRLNHIHHTGCIIFEALPTHLKIHNYLKLLDPHRQQVFQGCLERILQHVDKIHGQGVSGFMKLPYKNTRQFSHLERKQDHFYPRNPKAKKR
ncbi:serine/threonine protein kinase [Shewanella mangrovi]|uniref:Serine/threonine protein kinase n=1 Tax=Shewanella mangrovi TaxID=1515746 RepID=A0A094JG40_9GAMM|nr:protein kinase [Shewanella mangrovi]KFZ38880.1 serine/threonine protein kinase [Shewanella mangrovi]